MRIEAFARLGVAVATALVVLPAVLAHAYAPPNSPDAPVLEAPLLEAPLANDPVEMRPTTGRKGGLPLNRAPLDPHAAPPQLVPDPDPSAYGAPEGDGDGGGEGEEGTPSFGDMPFAGRAHLADIRYGDADLPAPVAERRRRLIAAARTGDIQALREVFADQPLPPVVAPLDPPDDPIEFLRDQSGDAEGREILAIMIELLEAGYVKVGEGAEETYVWPYFAEVPLTELKPEHYVELYRMLTTVDVEDLMREGGYGFFRIGISPEGRLRYFTASEIE